jgi:hypothetical protein
MSENQGYQNRGRIADNMFNKLQVLYIYQFLAITLVLFMLSACSMLDGVVDLPNGHTNSEQSTDVTLTVMAMTLVEPVEVTNTQTPTPMVAVDPSATIELSNITDITSTPGSLCELAGAGNPLDVSIPDDTRMLPGETFSKTWRLVNRGTCVWTREYSLAWFSGTTFETPRLLPLSGQVIPGQVVEMSIDMTAPNEPGVYTGYWMLRNPNGDLFGIGPGGNAPFWVRIQVVAVSTPTPTVTITATPTPVVQASGSVDLNLDDEIDLDTGVVNPLEGADLVFHFIENGDYIFAPLNNSRVGLFTNGKPEMSECRRATLESQPFLLAEIDTPVYLCYRTSLGLPGRIDIDSLPETESPFTVDFITWAVP